jgi:hypothetical protein
MSAQSRERAVQFALLLFALIVLLPGINWGLPSRDADRFLFPPPAQPWTGAQIQTAGGAWAPSTTRPADADTNPLHDHAQLIPLNDTPQKQAEILRRYRLFSQQPDEMITFMALSGMRGGHFDPRVYQYGGLWFYPVGAMLRIASMLHLIHVTPDLNYYLDHPEAFGRFYIVARLYSTLWAIIGAWAVFRLTRRFSGNLLVPATATACFIFLPVVINGAHEAKPHLAGAVLTLLTILAATRYVETGQRRAWICAAILCGAAVGMVLTALLSVIVLPLMVLLRNDSRSRRTGTLFAAAGIAIFVYCITNPYVPINLVRNPAIVRENLAALGQAKALTGQSTSTGALLTTARLISSGASPPLAILGFTGILAIVFFAGLPRIGKREPLFETPKEKAGVLLAAPALLALAQFAWFAAGKPGEYGRFAILPDILFAIAAVAWRPPLLPERFRVVGASVLVAATALFGLACLATFVEDAKPQNSRTRAAEQLQALTPRAFTLAVPNDPAPYNLPPLSLEHWKIFRLPDGAKLPQPAPDVIVKPIDTLEPPGPVPGTTYTRVSIRGSLPWLPTPISWADKPFEILIRQDLLAP